MATPALDKFTTDVRRFRAVTAFQEGEIERYLREYLITRFLVDTRFRLQPIQYDVIIKAGEYSALLDRALYGEPKEISNSIPLYMNADTRDLLGLDRSIELTQPASIYVTLDKLVMDNGKMKDDYTLKIQGQISLVNYLGVPIDPPTDPPTYTNDDLETFLLNTNRLYRLILSGTYTVLQIGRAHV